MHLQHPATLTWLTLLADQDTCAFVIVASLVCLLDCTHSGLQLFLVMMKGTACMWTVLNRSLAEMFTVHMLNV